MADINAALNVRPPRDVRSLRIILNDQKPGDCDILALRAALSAINEGYAIGEIVGIGFADGSHYAVKVNKGSVSVWPQRKD